MVQSYSGNEQAVAITDLLQTYRRLDELCLPLWQLGFSIPLERVRPSLLEPLLTTMANLEAEVNVEPDGRTSLEDDIDQQVFEIRALIESKLPVLDVPDTTLATVVNVIVNSGYNFGDQPYEDGVQDLRRWEQSLGEKCGTIFDEGLLNPEVSQGKTDLLMNAPFISRYLSLPRLAEAMQVCTDEDLHLVQRDLQVGREMVSIFKRMVDLFGPFLPETWHFSRSDIAVIFNFGRPYGLDRHCVATSGVWRALGLPVTNCAGDVAARLQRCG